MFEKEADEYADNTRIKDKNTYVSFPNECISELQDFEGNYIDISERIIKTFKDGAEFGYNKANEWHYVKDGLPKESKKYYVYSEEWGVEIRKFIADADCFECRNNFIIAWKEIVLPKEIKEND